MKIRARIKYCGGCNPEYDRVALVEQIKARSAGSIEWVSGEAEACDVVVAVHGCKTACADLTAFDGYEIYHITCPEDGDRFITRYGQIQYHK